MIRAAATVIWASGCLDYAQRCRPDPNEIETIPCDGVCINEIGAANADLITDTADRGNSDSTEATEDWVELYNNADHSIGLGYLELVRNDNGFAISRLPPITLEPGGCVLLVASAEPDRGPYTLAFDLNSDFGTLRLRTVDESCLVDRLWYPLQNELESYGRVPDGGTWTAMRDRTPCGDPEPLSPP